MKPLAILLQVVIGFHHFQMQHLFLPQELTQTSIVVLFLPELASGEAEYKIEESSE